MSRSGGGSSSTSKRSTFQGRRYVSPKWFKEMVRKEDEHWYERGSRGDYATGPLTEPFPRRREGPTFRSRRDLGSALGWNYTDVVAWLRDIGLPEYVPLFRKHRISGPALLSLRSSHLREMNVPPRRWKDFFAARKTLKEHVRHVSRPHTANPRTSQINRRLRSLRKAREDVVKRLRDELRFDNETTRGGTGRTGASRRPKTRSIRPVSRGHRATEINV